MTKKRPPTETETAPTSTQPKKAKKPKAKASKKSPDSPSYPEALLGKQFTHGKRSEWGVGTVIDGAESLVVLSWSDGVQRRTARSHLDQLIEVT